MRMRPHLARLLLLAGGLVVLPAWAGEPAVPAEPAALTVIEGRVAKVDAVEGEGGLPVVRVQLEGDKGIRRLLLAPAGVLEEIDFAVAPGDRIRARTFVPPGEGPPEEAAVQKIMNLTKSRMIRLRTLRCEPLWDGEGVWQGGPARRHRGGREQQGKHGGHRGGGP